MVASVSPILVFGGSGQLGLDLVRTAADRGVPLSALSRTNADIANRDAVESAIAQHRPSLVVNAAAYTKVDDSEVEREAAERANITGPSLLAGTCAAANIPLVHISSDYVFNGTKQGSYNEDDAVAPIGFYGLTKARGEDAVRSANARHVILRVSWLFGEFGNNFLKTMLRLASQREEFGVVADQHGCPTSTRDLASAILRIADRVGSDATTQGTFHFAGDGITTWHGFASAAVGRYSAITGRNVTVRAITTAEYPTRTKRPANSALDCSKFEKTFGFRGRPWRQEVEEIADILVRSQAGGSTGDDRARREAVR